MFLRLFVLGLLVGLGMTSAGKNDFGCLNFQGETVDWFFMYKEPNGQRYLYYDAKMAGCDSFEKRSPHILPLSDSRKMLNASNGPNLKCPLVMTIAQALPKDTASSVPLENTLLFAWNDQKDPTSSSGGHAKGVLGLHYEKKENKARSFFIQHTLPRFPIFGTMFESNLEANAQHFFCMSFEDQVEVHRKMIVQSGELIEKSSWFRLLWLYGAQCRVNYFYRYTSKEAGIFSSVLGLIPELLKETQGCQTNSTQGTAERLSLPEGLSSFEIRTTARQSELALRVFAKSPSYHLDIYDDLTALLSAHHLKYAEDTGAFGPNARNVTLLMIAQSYVDRTTLGLNQKHLCSTPSLNARVHIVNSFSISLPASPSAAGSASALSSQGKQAVELNVPVPITSQLESVEVLSPYKDHSKWSINVLYGHTGFFSPLLCFYDLNRTGKQAHRGGGAFCLNSSLTKSTPGSILLWQLFMALKPCPSNMARFVNKPKAQVLGKILPVREEERAETSSAFLPESSGKMEETLSGSVMQTEEAKEDSSRTIPSDIPCTKDLKKRKSNKAVLSDILGTTASKKKRLSETVSSGIPCITASNEEDSSEAVFSGIPCMKASMVVSGSFDPQITDLRFNTGSTIKRKTLPEKERESISTRNETLRKSLDVSLFLPTVLERSSMSFESKQTILTRVDKFAGDSVEIGIEERQDGDGINLATQSISATGSKSAAKPGKRISVPCPYPIRKASDTEAEGGAIEGGSSRKAVEALVDLLRDYDLTTVERAIQQLKTRAQDLQSPPKSTLQSSFLDSSLMGSANRGQTLKGVLNRYTSSYQEDGLHVPSALTQSPMFYDVQGGYSNHTGEDQYGHEHEHVDEDDNEDGNEDDNEEDNEDPFATRICMSCDNSNV
jgi:hypothetical protein